MKILSSKNWKNALFGGFFIFSGRDLHADDIREHIFLMNVSISKGENTPKCWKKIAFFCISNHVRVRSAIFCIWGHLDRIWKFCHRKIGKMRFLKVFSCFLDEIYMPMIYGTISFLMNASISKGENTTKCWKKSHFCMSIHVVVCGVCRAYVDFFNWKKVIK